VFGTDGIRGPVGVEPITPSTIVHLGWALGTVIKKHYGVGSVLIGKDTRVSGYLLESSMEAGLSSAGMDVMMLGPLPTPAIAYLTQTARANALGKAHRMDDAVGRYVEFCKGTIPRKMDFKGLKVALDCANGAAYQTSPAAFHELGAEVHVINNKPDGFNIVLMVDRHGKVVDGDQLLFVIANSLKKQGRLKGGVVGTLMSNFGMQKALESLDIPFVRAKVGDRYVMQELKKRDWSLGGESSGHIICLDKTTTGDGLVSALQVLVQMKFMDKPLDELAAQMDMYPQTMINVRLPEGTNAAEICAMESINKAVNETETKLAETGRVLLRPSGTEPVIRVMVEGQDEALVNRCCQELAGFVENQL